MLTNWLREYERPTSSALAEAVRSPSVGHSHLAQEIQQQLISSADEKEKSIPKIGMFPLHMHTRMYCNSKSVLGRVQCHNCVGEQGLRCEIVASYVCQPI